jgi:putative ABC transport system permease protein
VVISEAMARKYFGSEDPMGKMIQFQDTVSLKVTGVLQPLPGKTHLDIDFVAHSKLLLNQLIGFRVDNAYVGLWYYSYVVLQPGASAEALQQKFPDFVKKYYPPRYTQNNAQLSIQNIRDIHLYSDFSTADLSPNGDIQYVYTLGSIAVLVLLIACINFMNLSIARFSNRGKEVGIRKVMGAEKHNLVVQFLGESVLIALLAGVLSLAVVWLVLPLFNDLASVQLDVRELVAPQNLLAMLAIILATGLLAGIYPSLVMASFQPVKVLKGLHKTVSRRIDLRKALVVAQFTVSLILLIGTLVISDQLDFMRGKNMGFDKEQVVVLPVGGAGISRDFATFKNQLLRVPGVASVTSLSHDLGQKALPYLPMRVEGKEDEQMLPIMYVGYDFLETFGIGMNSGRFFDIGSPSDSTQAFVINEAAARALGWSDVLGRKLMFGVNGDENSRVIGVVRDFNFDPLRTRVGPLVMAFGGAGTNVALKIRPGDHRETLAAIEQQWNSMINSKAFSYYFLDEALSRTYEAEEKLARIFTYFCSLAIFVASMGLFALASFSAERRLKEIGVRKVLGASEPGLVLMMYKEFFVLIAVAFVLASPVAYYLFDQWLSGFAYRIAIAPFTFLVAVLFISFIALVTVGYQSITAARTNPVQVLRSE